MQAFEYASPKTTEEAVKLLASDWGQTEVLAGGTDLVSLMKDYVSTPNRVVSLKDIKELRGIEYKSGSGLRLGATATLQELIDSPEVKRSYPARGQGETGRGGGGARTRAGQAFCHAFERPGTRALDQA